MTPADRKPELVWRGASSHRLRLWPLLRWSVIGGGLAALVWVGAPYVQPIAASVGEFVATALKPAEPAPEAETETAATPPGEPPAAAPATPWAEVPTDNATEAAPPASAAAPAATPATPPPATPWAEVPSDQQSPPLAQPPAAAAPAVPNGGPAAAAEGVPSTAGEPPASAAEPDTSSGEPEAESEPDADAQDSFTRKDRPRTENRARPGDPLAPDPKGRGDGYFNGKGFN